jgi:hypothetical protein
MADRSRPIERRIEDAVERMRRLHEAAVRVRRAEPIERRIEDQAESGPPRR